MASKKTTAKRRTKQPDSVADTEGTLPATSTAGRRHRPSTKARPVETPTERRTRMGSRASRVKTGRGSKQALKKVASARREDKREDPKEMVSDAGPKNLKADKKGVKSKGKSTHELESQSGSAKPSRKSRRGGANRIKPDSQLRRRATRAVRSPESRHEMRGG